MLTCHNKLTFNKQWPEQWSFFINEDDMRCLISHVRFSAENPCDFTFTCNQALSNIKRLS